MGGGVHQIPMIDRIGLGQVVINDGFPISLNFGFFKLIDQDKQAGQTALMVRVVQQLLNFGTW